MAYAQLFLTNLSDGTLRVEYAEQRKQCGILIVLSLLCGYINLSYIRLRVKRSTGHTHTHRLKTTPPTPTHTHAHDENNTPNTSHKALNNARRCRREWCICRTVLTCKKINRSHTHAHTDREQHPRQRHTHTHDKNNTPSPQTNPSHKYLTMLEGGATTVRATSHTRVGGRAEVSVRGRVEVRRGLGRAIIGSGAPWQCARERISWGGGGGGGGGSGEFSGRSGGGSTRPTIAQVESNFGIVEFALWG